MGYLLRGRNVLVSSLEMAGYLCVCSYQPLKNKLYGYVCNNYILLCSVDYTLATTKI